MKKIAVLALFALSLCSIPLMAEIAAVDNNPTFPPIEPPAINPLDQESDRFFMEFIRMMSILGLVIVGLMFLSWYLKRFMSSRLEQQNSSSLIKVIERRDLTPKTALFILEVNNQQILIAETHSGVTALGEVHPVKREPSAFSQILDNKN